MKSRLTDKIQGILGAELQMQPTIQRPKDPTTEMSKAAGQRQRMLSEELLFRSWNTESSLMRWRMF